MVVHRLTAGTDGRQRNKKLQMHRTIRSFVCLRSVQQLRPEHQSTSGFRHHADIPPLKTASKSEMSLRSLSFISRPSVVRVKATRAASKSALSGSCARRTAFSTRQRTPRTMRRKYPPKRIKRDVLYNAEAMLRPINLIHDPMIK